MIIDLSLIADIGANSNISMMVLIIATWILIVREMNYQVIVVVAVEVIWGWKFDPNTAVCNRRLYDYIAIILLAKRVYDYSSQ